MVRNFSGDDFKSFKIIRGTVRMWGDSSIINPNYAYGMCARNVKRGTEFKVIGTLIDTS